jgi:hypothetical protein
MDIVEYGVLIQLNGTEKSSVLHTCLGPESAKGTAKDLRSMYPYARIILYLENKAVYGYV